MTSTCVSAAIGVETSVPTMWGAQAFSSSKVHPMNHDYCKRRRASDAPSSRTTSPALAPSGDHGTCGAPVTDVWDIIPSYYRV
ncbi:hypothetical protein V2G26_009107 [Clonostachys chloroleuca]